MTAEQQLERQADRLIAGGNNSHTEYPCYPEEYLRRKSARHRECYLEESYAEIEYCPCGCNSGLDTLPGMVAVLAIMFRLPGELVIDILAGDPTAGLPSSWPDVDELKKMRNLQRI